MTHSNSRQSATVIMTVMLPTNPTRNHRIIADHWQNNDKTDVTYTTFSVHHFASEVLPNFQFKTNVAKMDIVGDKFEGPKRPSSW